MTDTSIKSIWIYKSTKYDEEKKELKHPYEVEINIEGAKQISFEVTLSDDIAQQVFKIVAPEFKKALQKNMEIIPDEL